MPSLNCGCSLFCVSNGSRAMLKTFVWHTRLTFDSIFYLGAVTCFVYPSANRTLPLHPGLKRTYWSTGSTAGRNSRLHYFPAALLVSLGGTPTCPPILGSVNLCKIFRHTELKLGEVLYLFIFYNIISF